MHILAAFFEAIIGYFIFIAIGANLMDTVCRGVVHHGEKDKVYNRFSADKDLSAGSIVLTIIFSLTIPVYFYYLYHYWNIGITIAAAMLMASSLPQILHEIKTGRKINLRSMSKRPLDILCIILYHGAFPLLWYSLI